MKKCTTLTLAVFSLMLLGVTSAYAAIGTPTSIGTAINSTASTTLKIGATAAVPVGNTIIVTVTTSTTSPTVSVSDVRSNTYTQDLNVANSSTIRTIIFSAPVTTALISGDSITVTFSASAGVKAASVLSVSGLVSAGLADQTASGTGNSGTTASTGKTPTRSQADELLIGALGIANKNEAPTAQNSFTIIGTVSNNSDQVSLAPEYQIVSATGQDSASWAGLSNNKTWAAALVTYKACIPPGTSATGGQLTCATTSVVLSASSSTGGVSFSWSGTGIVSGGTTANPRVSATGTYTVTITPPYGNCPSTATASVTQNISSPGASATGGTLTCAVTSVVLSASSTSGTGFSWAGTGISSGGTTANPTVTAAGTFTVTVTNSANGCTSTATTSVNLNNTAPGASATGGTLTCTTTSVVLSASSTSGTGFSWAGTGISAGGTTANPTVTAAGTFTVTVTNSANGCTSTATASVGQNITLPGASATGGTLTCATTTVVLSASTTTGTGFSWAGPGIVSNGTTAHPTVSASGTYTVTVTTAANGCTSTATTLVNADIATPGASATGGALSCATTSVTLSASSTSGTGFSWTGPGIVSGGTTAHPVVSAAGSYLVTVTNSANGCTSTASALVSGDFTAPGASATGGTLTCTITAVVLSASSTSSTGFSWAGPGISSGGTTANPTVTAAGTFTVTVTNSANGCTSTATTSVNLNNTAPGASATGGTLTCTTTSVVLSASSTSGTGFSWSGPGIVSDGTTAHPTVSATGIYSVTVTNSANGCSSTATASVGENITLPGASATGGTLTCATTTVVLSASTENGTGFSWAGPGIVSNGTTAHPTVSASGTYTVTVTTAANGCTSTATALVNADITTPGASATGGTLTCATTSIVLSASSTNGTGFSWAGPGIASGGTTAHPTITAAGTYTVTVTDDANGCTSTATAEVINGAITPGASATGGTLTCTTTSVVLSAATTTGTGYSWSGPGIVSGNTTANPVVSASGTFTVTVTNSANGCTSTATANVNENITLPGASATGGTLTCTTTSVVLSASSTSGNQYSWSGPGIVSGNTTANPVVSASGTFTVTVTNSANGCTSTATADVNENITTPGASATGGTLTCTTTSVVLSAATTSGTGFTWAGTGIVSGGTTANPRVSASGTFTVTVTNSANGCTSTATALVNSTATPPGASATGGTLTCTTTSVVLSAATPNGTGFSWAGTGIVSGGTTANPRVSATGTFTVTVTNSSTGCVSTTVASVNVNATVPGASATGGTLTSTTTSVVLSATTTSGTGFSWAGPGIVSGGTTANPRVSSSGTFTVTVTNSANGCTSTATAMVLSQVVDNFLVEAEGGGPIGTQAAGTSFNIRITARDAGNGTVTGFTGTVNLTTNAGIITPAVSGAFVSGVRTQAVTLTQAGTNKTITATQTGGSPTGTSNTFTVNAGAFSKLQLLVPGETAAPGTASGKTGTPTATNAGAAFNVTVNAVDANWNVVSSITDSVMLSSTDPNATLPAKDALIAGTRTLSVALKTAPSQTLTARDASDTTKTLNTSPAITVIVGPAAKVRVETAANGSGIVVPAQNIPSGNSISVFAISRDLYDNFIANVNGTWSLVNKTGNVVDGDLVPVGGGARANFNAAGFGTAEIQASSGGLAMVRSGVQTVLRGVKTWQGANGASGDRWDRAQNWVENAAPIASDSVIIPSTGVVQYPVLNVAGVAYALLIQNGASLNFSTFDLTAGGDVMNNGTVTSTTGALILAGSSGANLSGTGAFNNVTINKTGGAHVNLGSNVRIDGALTLMAGLVRTGSDTLTISSTGSVTRTAGHVVGNFRKFIATGVTSKTFEVGDTASYAPVSVSFASVTNGGNLTVRTTPGDHPNIGASSINPVHSVNRYWTITKDSLVFTTYGATFIYVAGDIDAGANSADFYVGKDEGGFWSVPSVGTRTATSTQATGMTSFSDFIVGERLILVKAKVLLAGAYTSAGDSMFNTLKTDGHLAAHFTGVPIPSRAVDSITVEIRDSATAAAATQRVFAPAWLLTDGTICSFTDSTKPYAGLNATSGNYYVVIYHRNHLPIMSANPLAVGAASSLYNFTTAQTQAYGTAPMDSVAPGRFAMISGDVDANGSLNAVDRSIAWNERGLEGYQASDVDLNGVCNATDRSIIWNNRGRESQVP